MKSLHDNNFWDVNKELLILEQFSKYYSDDKSKDKQDSSKILWAVFYAYSPDSKFFNYPNKLEVLSKDFIKNPKFKWESIRDIIDAFKNLVLSDAERATMHSQHMKFEEMLDKIDDN